MRFSDEKIDAGFERFVKEGEFCVIGVGGKCAEAVKYAFDSTTRIDLVQLFAPNSFIDLKPLWCKGVLIEVYFKQRDDFSAKFREFATIYTIKD